MIKHKIYTGVNCTQSDQQKTPLVTQYQSVHKHYMHFRAHHPKEWHPDISFSPHDA